MFIKTHSFSGIRPAIALAAFSCAANMLCAQDGGGDALISEKSYQTTVAQRAQGAASFLNDLKLQQQAMEKMTPQFFIEGFSGGVMRPLPLRDKASEIASQGFVLAHTLTVDYGDNHIFNPKEGRDVPLHLRSYNKGLIGPTLRVRPGQLMKIRLDNILPIIAEPPIGDINKPHISNFNITNLHTHGLHVSPGGNSDNVFVQVRPKEEFEYEIYVPEGHPGGTFWYHAHVHGSTAIQVASGMAGPLIVEGGLDDLPVLQEVSERILFFQQIPYTCNENGQYVLESYDHFGVGAWRDGSGGSDDKEKDKGWRTSVSGLVQPLIHIAPGEVQRWRMIHSGQRESLNISIVPLDSVLQWAQEDQQRLAAITASPDSLSDDVVASTVRDRVKARTADMVDLHEIAADGLSYGFSLKRARVNLEPGYRSDVLVQVDKPGMYVLVDGEVAGQDALQGIYERNNVLAYVQVSGQPKNMRLPDDSELAPTRPHKSIEVPHEGLPLQQLEFAIEIGDEKTTFKAGNPGESKPYDPADLPRQLKLNTDYEWHLTSTLANHPFHIHVNPFEIVEWKDADGTDLLVVDGKRRTIWKDTVLIKGPNPNAPDVPNHFNLRIRSRTERYVGKFVLHCHILDHEDQGMMQEVEITTGSGGHGHGHR